MTNETARAVGVALLTAPLLAFFVLTIIAIGPWWALLSWTAALVFIGAIWVGASLYFSGEQAER